MFRLCGTLRGRSKSRPEVCGCQVNVAASSFSLRRSAPTGYRKGLCSVPTGQVKFFDSRKGFGFIKPDDNTRDVFIGINNLPKGLTVLPPDQRCTYIATEGKAGKGPAVDGKLTLL
jgi:CspA family cold shock protein